MGFVAGNSCFLHSSLYQFPFPSSSSSFQSNSWARNAHIKKKFRAPMACLHQESPNERAFCNKRSVIFMGIAVLPLLGFKARAIEGLATKESNVETPEDNQKIEIAQQSDRPPNPFVSFLNAFGIISSGVLGALYARAQQESSTARSTVEMMNRKLKDKEELIVSLKKDYDSKLQNEQQERSKQLGKAKEEQQALMNEINKANDTTARLGKELKNEKSLGEELKLQIENLRSELSKAGADKEGLEKSLKEKVDSIENLQGRINLLSSELKEKEDVAQNLSSSLAEKESELRDLNSAYNQTKDDVSNLHLHIQGLKDELRKRQDELEAKESLVNELNAKISSLTFEREDYRTKYGVLEEEYNGLKLKAALDAKLLEETKGELHQLNEKLQLALSEAKKNQAIIADLTKERDSLNESLKNESQIVDNLKHELQITQENLGKSRNEAAELEIRLNESNILNSELKAEVSELSVQLMEVKKSLQKSLDDAELGAETLTVELKTVKEHLNKTQLELQSKSNELITALESRDSLQRELVDVYKKAETAAEDLKEERKLVTSLNAKLQYQEQQVTENKEAQRSLEKDLEDATKSLDELNRNTLVLSDEYEKARSLISTLENENKVLQKSLAEQKVAQKEAQENTEDAHVVIMRLGKEKETFESRSKKLEEELASAKGEILRLRNEINSSKVIVNNEPVQNSGSQSKDNKVTVNSPKNVRRRRSNPQ
ncbi:hypothetical protein K1719_018797 [Acacia pycnantha]|nr:hypothetical protein K1719_018797 [Acacia pycnantha]